MANGARAEPPCRLEELAQVVVASSPAASLDAPDHPMRRVTRETAFDPDTWTPQRAHEVATAFDELAPGWDARLAGRESESEALVADAISRGGIDAAARALEIGAGTGRATRHLVRHLGSLAHFGSLVALDLSRKMLVRAPAIAPRVQADASRLPFPARCFDAVVMVNALLFPAEVARVLRPDGVLLWINTLAEDTPIHLPPRDVAAALPGRWEGRWARAGHGLWATLRHEMR